MESPWPSRNVAQGGFLKPAKASYSKDTKDLIKLLMEESKLSMMQRKNINYHLRCGTPLPNPTDSCPRKSIQYDTADQQAFNIMQRARERNGRKRTLTSIIQSGAFEVERFVPKGCNREPCDRAKLRLQEIMSGVPINPELEQLNVGINHKYRKSPKMDTPSDCIAQLLSEIYERADWLAEMEELGESKKHRNVIHLQIASRLREIERLEKATAVKAEQ